jgi:hypothetical protein
MKHKPFGLEIDWLILKNTLTFSESITICSGMVAPLWEDR